MAQKRNTRSYDNEYKAQAVKLARKLVGTKQQVNWEFQRAPFIVGLRRLRKDG